MERKYLALLYIIYSHSFGDPPQSSTPVTPTTAVSNSSRRITVPNCGRALWSEERIVGGRMADPGQFPWMVSLYEKGRNSNIFSHVCGGTVLNENWILTAAHCVNPAKPSDYRVKLGLHRHSHPNDPLVQELSISKIVVHEKANKRYDNDIALLKTATSIDIAGSKGYINGICLPKRDSEPTGHAIVTGWGDIEFGHGKDSDTLKYAFVSIIPRKVCNEAFDPNPQDRRDRVTESMICAGNAQSDACQNDSGGPLIQISKKGIATLIGVVSFGKKCGEDEYPGVYMKVASFRDWIQDVVSRG